MSDILMERAPKVKPVPATVKFVYIGDPNDNGAGSRAFEDDDDDFRGIKLYGIKFPKGKAVDVRQDAVIAGTEISIVAKLQGNSHFFEGTEAEFAAAVKAGEIKRRKAPEKPVILVKNLGVRGMVQPDGIKTSSDGDDDE